MKKPKPDCRSCGACCVSFRDQDAYCDVTEADLEKLSRRWVKKNVLLPRPIDYLAAAIDGADLPYAAIRTRWKEQRTGPLKGCQVCACVALQGSVLSRVHCSIYEKRPGTCKEAVKPGDGACRHMRRLLKEQEERC